ncbi:MAG: acetylornithine deacetylase [Rhodospirillales bacterium]
MAEPKHTSTVEILESLIAFDTTSRNPNRPMIDWIAGYLSDLGVESTIVVDDDPGKANLLATIGPTDAPGIVLAGHTDVVPVDGQTWGSDPFTLTERDGRLFGRGTADMKSWAALALAGVPRFLEAPLCRPVHLAFSYDEETTCLGAVSLGDAIAALPTRPALCIVGEPSGMRAVTGQKGCYCFTAEFQGLAAHSSLAPDGVNAVEYASRFAVFLSDLSATFAREGPFVAGYDVPHTTVHVGTCRGGTALNIVPEHCRLEFEFRNLPGHDAADIRRTILSFANDVLEPDMRLVSPDARIEIDEWSGLPGYALDDESVEVQLVRSLSGHNDDVKVTYFSEAGIYADRAAIPSLICGPGFIDQAHKPDEFISLDQITEGERFMDRLTSYLCRPG